MSTTPKAINCRLNETDTDIKADLMNYPNGKTDRIKEVYRKGLAFEAMHREPVTLKPADAFTATYYDNYVRVLKPQTKRTPTTV